jgi:hypothetical protein
MPEKKSRHPAYMRRCVAKVSKDRGLSAAFAICTSAMQKAGYIEPGSRVQTDAGKKRARQYAARKDFKDREADYELALVKGREEEFAEMFDQYVKETLMENHDG